MMDTKWSEKLEKGSKVLINYHTYSGGRPNVKVSKIERMTKTLFITESGDRFKKDGLFEPGDSWTKSYLTEWTPKDEYAIKERNAKLRLINKLKNNVDWNNIPIHVLEQIDKFL